MNRRFQFFCLVLLVPFFSPGAIARAKEKTKPNVVIIMANDHAAFACGAYGNSVVKTPSIDKLAAEGMRFTRAYSNCTDDTASHQSFLTGRQSDSIGVCQFQTPLSQDAVTIADLVVFNGYQALAAGDLYLFTSGSSYGFAFPIYGQENARSLLVDRGILPVKFAGTVHPDYEEIFKRPARDHFNADNRPIRYHENDLYERIIAKHLVDDLSHARERPFLAYLGMLGPGDRGVFPVEYADSFATETLQLPQVSNTDAQIMPNYYKTLSDNDKKGIVAAYYTAVKFEDATVGTILKGLEDFGLAEKTVVIYLSDGGLMMGQHGRFDNADPYEPAVRIPLIIRWPGHTKPGSVSDALVESIDIFTTIADICGSSPPPEATGISLVPLLEGKAEAPGKHEMIFSENLRIGQAMVRDDRYKLIYCSGRKPRDDGFENGVPPERREVRLFDLESDPDELTNVAAQPQNAALITKMKQEMLRRLLLHFSGALDFGPGASVEDQLDLLLIPREKWRDVEGRIRAEVGG